MLVVNWYTGHKFQIKINPRCVCVSKYILKVCYAVLSVDVLLLLFGVRINPWVSGDLTFR